MTNRKLVVKVIVGVDEAGKSIYKKRTIKNVRPELNDDQLREFVARYFSLTQDIVVETLVMDTRVLEDEDEFIPEVEKGVASVILEEKIQDAEKEARETDSEKMLKKSSSQRSKKSSKKVKEVESPQEDEKIPEKEEELDSIEIHKGAPKQFAKPFTKKRMDPPIRRSSKSTKRKR